MKPYLITAMLCTTSFANEQFIGVANEYTGKIGQSYVERNSSGDTDRGECEILVDNEGTYSTIKMKVQYDYGHFMFSNTIESVKEASDSLIFTARAHEDYNGELCGVWAPAKKVVSRAIFKNDEVILERTYRCPYFIFKSTDKWICRF